MKLFHIYISIRVCIFFFFFLASLPIFLSTLALDFRQVTVNFSKVVKTMATRCRRSACNLSKIKASRVQFIGVNTVLSPREATGKRIMSRCLCLVLCGRDSSLHSSMYSTYLLCLRDTNNS